MTEIYGPTTITKDRGPGSLEPGTVILKGMKTVWVGGVEFIIDAHAPDPLQRLLRELAG